MNGWGGMEIWIKEIRLLISENLVVVGQNLETKMVD